VTTALALTVGMARSWVALYTLRLPPEIREGRRCEIDSDLWEQQWLAARQGDPALGTAIEVLARMLLGVISDITWRAQAGSPARADRGMKMSESWPMSAVLVTVGVVLALFLIFSGIAGVAWPWTLVITIPIGIAMIAIAFFRARQTGGTVGIGVDRMRAKGKSQWKWLLLVIGVCVATFVGMWSYALSLEEWGDARVMIFGLASLLAVAAGFIALVLLISDLIGSVRRKTDS
jgi:hypothetical protein